MAFSVVHGSPQTLWCPIEDDVTLYHGQLVQQNMSAPVYGVEPLDVACGVFNETNYDIPFGVVIGDNQKNPLYNSTYKAGYITAPAVTDAHDGSSLDYVGVEGPWSKGDPIPMVKVAVIDPCTVLRGPIYHTAYGTPPTLLTATSITAAGLAATTNSDGFTGEARMNTIYCRTGANAGSYRITDTSSTTVHTWARSMRNELAVGDTFVHVPIRFQGFSTIDFDSAAMYIDGFHTPAVVGTDSFGVIVYRLDLSEAGKEYCEFRFIANHFCQVVGLA